MKKLLIDGRDIKKWDWDLETDTYGTIKCIGEGIVLHRGREKSKYIYKYEGRKYIVDETNSFNTEILDVTLIEISEKQIIE